MKRLILSTGIALAFILTIAMAWSRMPSAAAGKQLPYKASGPEVLIWEGPHEDCGPERFKVEIQGGGQATHLGQYLIVRQHCFNPALGTFEDGQFEQTAANGDQIRGTYEGFVEDVLEFGEDGSPVVIVINAPYTITGGAGRFAGASGEGSTRGVFNLMTQSGDFELEGWISYSASNRGQ
jgi:hypothetical protein